MSKENKPEGKKYQLKKSETQLLKYVKNHQDAIFIGVLSHIAIDRLAVNVGIHTQFELDADMEAVIITELPAPEDEKSVDSDVEEKAVKTAE